MYSLDNIVFIMVDTSLSANIGSAARAMLTMGLTNLRLVTPPEDHPSRDADSHATGAKELMDSAQVFDSLPEALQDIQLIIGTSARSRANPWPLIIPRELPELAKKVPAGGKIAVLFGRERSGLTNEELAQCHYHVHIPTNEDFSSLNIAQAIQVIAYEWRMGLHQSEGQSVESEEAVDLASGIQLERFFQHLEETLIDIDFLDPTNPMQLMHKMRRVYMRAQLEQNEVNMLRGVLTKSQRPK